jgi:hypothetical protein
MLVALAPALAVLASPLRAATESDIRSPAKHRAHSLRDIRVPIPGWSRDVEANGCQARRYPGGGSGSGDSGIAEVPFWGLVEHATGRYSVELVVGDAVTFTRKIAALDADMRRLVLLYVLADRWGRDGLHTFFFLDGGAVAPAIRDALESAGLARELDVFSRAMALFGDPYPVANDVRAKFFGYSMPGGELNSFDRRMLALAREFGTRKHYRDSIVGSIERTPALWRRIEGLREKLGEPERLRFLIDALPPVDLWQPGAEIERKLSALSPQQRTLLAAAAFMLEFENGGVHQFFYNSEGSIAPEVRDAMIELGLERQAGIIDRGLAMFGKPYVRDTQRRREMYFHKHEEWTDWDRQLSALTDDFYALDGGPAVHTVRGNVVIEGGPGLRDGMLDYARRHHLLPC